MPLSEYDSKEALRVAADWLTASELPGSAAALEGIADTIPLVMMGLVELNDLDDLAGDRRKARAHRARCRYAAGRATIPTQAVHSITSVQSVAMPCDELIRPAALRS
jgi:hypothetical protein